MEYYKLRDLRASHTRQFDFFRKREKRKKENTSASFSPLEVAVCTPTG
jgi:hypothetical protein